MSDEIERKFVKPAHSGACIPDPAHPGIDLAQDGAEVPWDHYWIGRLNREEIVIVEPVATAPAKPPKAGAETA